MNAKIKDIKTMNGLPTNTLETIYFKGILPSMTYGISVWGNCSIAKMEKFEKVHLRAARIVHKIPKEIHEHEVLQSVKWMPISYM